MTDSAIIADIHAPFALDQAQRLAFREQGFIKLKQVFAPATLAHYGTEITEQVRRLNRQTKPMVARSTYEKAFLQVTNLWRESELVKEFCSSRRLARLAAELMGVDGVRMYHDQALYKEAGGGITPWHCDQQYWPLSSDRSVTAWIPLQAVPVEMGPLAFSIGSHRCDFGRDLEISDESERSIAKALTLRDLPIEESAFALGEISFHSGWTFHRASPNRSAQPRAVMTVIYIEDGIRLAAPKNRNQENDARTWMPGTRIGEVVDTPLNPLLYSCREPVER